MFKCLNEQCIPFWWKCDGTEDCGDASDELECPPGDDSDSENPEDHARSQNEDEESVESKFKPGQRRYG